MNIHNIRFVFFGTCEIAVFVLEELEAAGLVPHLLVTQPDRPFGRKQVITPPPVKLWAKQKSIPVYQPHKLNDPQVCKCLQADRFDIFVVASYGKIIPPALFNLPKHGSLNMHPSLLPKFRGVNPIRAAILADERATGVSIMLLDEEMDYGPILRQMTMNIAPENWPVPGKKLDEALARMGGSLLAASIPAWVSGEIEAKEQNHTLATYTKKFSRADAEINLKDDPYQNYLKICAHDGWPGTFFYHTHNKQKLRIKINKAIFQDNHLHLKEVTPEGRAKMTYEDFSHGFVD